MRGRHVAREDFLLDYVRPNPMEREGKRGKRREKKRRGVRSSTFSLEFPEIGLSVFVGARGKVLLRGKSFMWV